MTVAATYVHEAALSTAPAPVISSDESIPVSASTRRALELVKFHRQCHNMKQNNPEEEQYSKVHKYLPSEKYTDEEKRECHG